MADWLGVEPGRAAEADADEVRHEEPETDGYARCGVAFHPPGEPEIWAVCDRPADHGKGPLADGHFGMWRSGRWRKTAQIG